MRGRTLYLKLAERSYENAVEHFHDARALRRRGSRGHACSLAILSVEEAAKAFLYKLAGEGVYRIVSRKPNGISTYSESQLFDHRFKHAIVARLVYQGILSGPVQRVMAKNRRESFSRRQVELMLWDLLHEQEMQQIRLRQGGRASDSVKHLFDLLERSNSRKNAGFYVGHEGGRPTEPNELTKKELDEFIDLAGVILDDVGPSVGTSLTPQLRRQVASQVREVARAVRGAAKQTRAKLKEPSLVKLASTTPSGTI